MVRVDMMAGMAHAPLEINDIMLLPFIPNFCISPSNMNTTLLMYPSSSKTAMRKNNIAICGMNTKNSNLILKEFHLQLNLRPNY